MLLLFYKHQYDTQQQSFMILYCIKTSVFKNL